ncbi:DNA polymerase delta subunit 4-like, partial [Neopsephotus bourkii]|uniref:DNA polymerase delta subunit 4-like n=1 Tax=Neopsephotus bourkii TaxID=309878 RepID=UPI002AA5C7B5
MEQPRLITDSFPLRRRRQRPGRAPGTGKGKGKGKGTGCPRVPAAEEEPPGSGPDPSVLEMLRSFDLAWEYGPCTGITRLQRWERAQELGLSPPDTVRDALLEHQDDPSIIYKWVLNG